MRNTSKTPAASSRPRKHAHFPNRKSIRALCVCDKQRGGISLTDASNSGVSFKIQHVVTQDLEDGQPLPPPDGYWAVACRHDGRTLWRQISLQAQEQ